MYKGIPYSNKIVKRRQQQRLQVIHKQNLRNVRPLTMNIDLPFQAVANPYTNNKKKDMLQQDRFTQIERENRMLLQKIHMIMNKKPSFKPEKIKRNSSINHEKQRMNKSLNNVYRRKQLEDIEIQNAKLLKRIMDKKSDYDSKRLKEEWKKQKTVIKNIANYPFIIRDRIYKGRKKSLTSQSFHQGGLTNIQPQQNSLSSPIQLIRIRNLGGEHFLVTVKYDGNSLQILGDNKTTKEIKIIEIPKQEGLEFIQYECDGKIELIFDCLRYDPVEKILYLVGKDVEVVNIDKKDERLEKNQEDKQNNQQIVEHKLDELEQNQLQEGQKGLKNREMSNIYEIQNSQMETEPNKVIENQLNFINADSASQLPTKNLIEIRNEHIKETKEQNNELQKQPNHNQQNTNSLTQQGPQNHIQNQSTKAQQKQQTNQNISPIPLQGQNQNQKNQNHQSQHTHQQESVLKQGQLKSQPAIENLDNKQANHQQVTG